MAEVNANVNELLWVQRYRPRTVADTILPVQTKAQFQKFVDDENVPNLLLAGLPGTGKTTAAKAMLDELARDPLFSRKMIASLSVRLHHLITDVESYSLHSGRQRIIGYLLRDNTETDARALTITLPTSKGTIASRLNLTQEHFSRILHELSEAGLIVVEGRRITIPDVEKLRGYDL